MLFALMASSSQGIYIFAMFMSIILLIVMLRASKEMSNRQIMEDKLRRLAHYDSLTNLPNRPFFHELLHREITRAKRG